MTQFTKHSPLLLVLALLLSACAAVADTAFRFAELGDTRGNSAAAPVNDTIVTEMRDQMLTENIDLVMVGGDLVYSGAQTQLEHWATLFMDPLLTAGIKVYPTRGNHDSDMTAWNNVFTGTRALPANGPGASEVTYYVNHKTALLVAMDRLPAKLAVNQAWLDPVFAANTLPHVFVMNHYPAYAVYHADCLDDNLAERNAFWDSMGTAGCRVYFCGHDHLYNHARAQDAAGNWIHQYLVGAGGAPFYTWGGTYADPSVQLVLNLKEYGYCVVDVAGAQVTLTYKKRGTSPAYTPYIAGDTYTYISPLAKVTADFDATPTTGNSPLAVDFTDASASNVEDITGWLWDFGDGATSVEQNPSHSYAVAGDYTVSLAVTTAHMQGTKTKPNSVHVDSVPPTGIIVINGNRSATNNTLVTLTLNWAPGSGGSVVRMRFSNDGATWTAWEPLAATRPHTLPGGDGHKTVRVQYLDAANIRSAVASDYIRLDTTPPTGGIVINGGAATTTTPSVTLGLTWADGGTGVTRMRFSDNGATWTGWIPQRSPRNHTLPAGLGNHTVRVQYLDGAGNYSPVYNDYIKIVAP
jgi:PKD repeat protein